MKCEHFTFLTVGDLLAQDKYTLSNIVRISLYICHSTFVIIVYQKGRLYGAAHEISGIPAPLWLHGWVVGGFLGCVDGGGVSVWWDG